MAERSKALVEGTSYFDGVGSNPTAAKFVSALNKGYVHLHDEINIVLIHVR